MVQFPVSALVRMVAPSLRREHGESKFLAHAMASLQWLPAGRGNKRYFVGEDYFCRKILRRISGQNSLTTLLMVAASICAAQFTAVLRKLRSSGG